jgi:TPR repeat protein
VFLFSNFSVEKLQILRDAATRGCPIAQLRLAMYYHARNGDPKRISHLFKSSARFGLDASQQNLSKCLQDGYGCETNAKDSFKWLIRAAVSGDSQAQARASEIYRLGVSGVINKNEEKAYHFARSSAKQFCMEGLYAAGMCVLYGIGVEKNQTKEEAAIGGLSIAAEEGQVKAAYQLGVYHLQRGLIRGDVSELGQAFTWMKMAAEQIDMSMSYSFNLH